MLSHFDHHLQFLNSSSSSLISSTQSEPSHQYPPAIWDYNFVESLKTNINYSSDTDMKSLVEAADRITKDVKLMLDDEKAVNDPLAKLELIGVIQSLGMSNIFEENINKILDNIYHENYLNRKEWMKDNLYATSLCFRLLRQHGFQVSQDVFSEFQDARGDFKESLANDVKGMLSLYEAAYLLSEGESIQHEAILTFTRRHLMNNYTIANDDDNFAKQVTRSLEMPFHWRMQRSQERWFIDVYEYQRNMNPLLLELAKMNFNMVQSKHQIELKHMSRWWKSLGIAKNLSFARDRLVECFLGSIGFSWEPKYERCREWITKTISFVLLIDDIYDWANMAKAMLVEAKWCHEGYIPTLEVYKYNGSVSSSGFVVLAVAFFALKQNNCADALRALENNHELLYSSCLVCRLSNDLATSSAELKRGELASSVYIYMQEANVCEKDAREHLRGLIMDMWKKMNKFILSPFPFDLSFVNLVLNFARFSLFMYQYGDGIGAEHSKSKEHVLSLIINPIHMHPANNNSS
ncbi:hypothetical protein MKX01_029911 [Papaver californicum]|nr:hypothetical protein MKX01_029911 [Papaver californicum]